MSKQPHLIHLLNSAVYTICLVRGYIIPGMDVNCSGVQCAMVSTYLSPRPLGEWWLRKWGISFQATSHLHHCPSIVVHHCRSCEGHWRHGEFSHIYMCNASGYQLPKNKMPSNISDTKEYTRVVFIGHKALSAHWNTCKCQSIAAFGSQICAEKAMRSCCSKSGTECRKQHGRERLESEKEI